MRLGGSVLIGSFRMNEASNGLVARERYRAGTFQETPFDPAWSREPDPDPDHWF